MLKTLKASRQEVDLTQKEAADMLGVSPCYLSSIENLHKKSPTLEARLWKIINQRRIDLQVNETNQNNSKSQTNIEVL